MVLLVKVLILGLMVCCASSLKNPCRKNGKQQYYEHPLSEFKYIQCSIWGQMFVFTCPNKLKWNSDTSSCRSADFQITTTMTTSTEESIKEDTSTGFNMVEDLLNSTTIITPTTPLEESVSTPISELDLIVVTEKTSANDEVTTEGTPVEVTTLGEVTTSSEETTTMLTDEIKSDADRDEKKERIEERKDNLDNTKESPVLTEKQPEPNRLMTIQEIKRFLEEQNKLQTKLIANKLPTQIPAFRQSQVLPPITPALGPLENLPPNQQEIIRNLRLRMPIQMLAASKNNRQAPSEQAREAPQQVLPFTITTCDTNVVRCPVNFQCILNQHCPTCNPFCISRSERIRINCKHITCPGSLRCDIDMTDKKFKCLNGPLMVKSN